MTCEEVEREELIEHYVLGRLAKEQQEAFEDHYFSCARCLERLRVVEETRGELAAQSVAVRPRWRRRAAAGLAAAAALVVAIRVGQNVWRDSETSPVSPSRGVDVALPRPVQPSASPLGEIELPPYTPPRLRSTPTDAQRVFRDTMALYIAGDCGAAIPGLRRSLTMDESLTPARFYLAACELQIGRVEDAAANLQRVIARGESPYLEDAHFFLAKARIRQGHTAAARQELTRVVGLRGDRGDEARRLLDQLR